MNFRYLIDMNYKDTKKVNCDVVIVGTGVAGLFTAMNIDEQYKVIILSKDEMTKSSSSLAQGGVAACMDTSEDNPVLHYEDTLKAGDYYNNPETTRVLVEDAPKCIDKLITYGVNFDRDKNGKFELAREGGHSRRRILHWKDATGKEIVQSLQHAVKKKKNIDIQEHVFAVDILKVQEKAIGIFAFNEAGEKVIYQSKAVVLATGGIGQIYKHTTNPSTATGDGIAMGYRAGAKVSDMEFVQFHPTALYTPHSGQKFLISEAVRGEGALLRNIYGDTFMEKYHERQELAPRDIVSRSIFTEMRSTKSSYVYLDITHKDAEFIIDRFPTIYKKCLENGIDMTKEWIPVAPTEHYMMGGVATDIDGQTTIDRLYSCGECVCTGVHGANRLASNSLLEGIVFGDRIASSINTKICTWEMIQLPAISCIKNADKTIQSDDFFEEIKSEIQDTMNDCASIIRSEEKLRIGLKKMQKLYKLFKKNAQESFSYFECMNICINGMLIIEGALQRKESIGAHYRIDGKRGFDCTID
jgi:L-aspartate oxidase